MGRLDPSCAERLNAPIPPACREGMRFGEQNLYGQAKILLIERSLKGALMVVGALNLGGAVEMVPNPVGVAELAVEKWAVQLPMPLQPPPSHEGTTSSVPVVCQLGRSKTNSLRLQPNGR